MHNQSYILYVVKGQTENFLGIIQYNYFEQTKL